LRYSPLQNNALQVSNYITEAFIWQLFKQPPRSEKVTK